MTRGWRSSLAMALLVALLPTACRQQEAKESAKEEAAPSLGALPDIPLLTFTDGSPCRTDLGSDYGILLGPEDKMPKDEKKRPAVHPSLKWESGNPYLSLRFERLARPHFFTGLWLSVFGHTEDPKAALPPEVAEQVTAVRFRVRAPERPVQFRLEVKTGGKTASSERSFTAEKEWKTLTLPLSAKGLRELDFVIESRSQPPSRGRVPSGVFELDDIRLVCSQGKESEPPEGEKELLAWARDRALRYFLWNYREPSAGLGIVLERNSVCDLVSIAGIGFALPALAVAGEEKLLPADQARARVLALMRWVEGLDCAGKAGRHGFPYRLLKPDGTRAVKSEVGTVDWAICAAGLRVARQHYRSDKEIPALAAKLLARPKWEAALTRERRISHGFGGDGIPLPQGWGSSFTEEAYLVAIEAVAAGGVEPDILGGLRREKRDGFWPSWFGGSATYNWLQLWTGPREPFASNSRAAYEREAAFCLARWAKPLLGATACETFSGADPQGFLKWDIYVGDSGPDVHLAPPGSVKSLSVCPHGAALALPFAREKAVAALREFIKLGAAHPLLGFADSVRMEELPREWKGPIPNWTQFAVDAGPLWMAIEAAKPDGGLVAGLYLKDREIEAALERLSTTLK